MMKDFVEYGTRKIDYALHFSERKTLGITVTPDMEVSVFAPLGADLEHIKAKVRKRAAWIVMQMSYFHGFYPRRTPRRYVSGETHLYLGRQYMLRIEYGSRQFVSLKGGILKVELDRPSELDSKGINMAAKQAVDSWYLELATKRIHEIALPLIERFGRHGVAPQGIIFRKMATRWGSCTPKGKIILNSELIQAPRGCIEYVITHELCHLVHLNHTERFYALQAQEMPDWKKWKDRLERILA